VLATAAIALDRPELGPHRRAHADNRALLSTVEGACPRGQLRNTVALSAAWHFPSTMASSPQSAPYFLTSAPQPMVPSNSTRTPPNGSTDERCRGAALAMSAWRAFPR
jgi:hypothetical protein